MSNGNTKKLMCNPPAEEVAGCGDPKLRGMFVGAGRVIDEIEDDGLRGRFINDVVKVEVYYMEQREKLARECEGRMQKAFDMVLGKETVRLTKD